MDKHTPGPWWVSAAKDCVWHADHGRICTPPNHAQVWNWEPNARLIAAAPDLLATLVAIDERLTECAAIPASAADAYDSDFQELVRDAIAKATGEATC